MIRRISKTNDLKDYIKSCPSGVIDDIYEIRYYIQGHPEYITASFSKVGEQLVAVLPTSQLEALPNGILMRRAFYKVMDTTYPDGYYNLEFEDNMNIWLGDYESEEPIIPEYVTEDELSSTLSSYATMSWVSSQEFATESWVSSQGYLTSHQDLGSYATMSWVESYTYPQSTIEMVAGKAYGDAVDWVQAQGYLTSHQDLSSYATQEWVLVQGFATIGLVSSTLESYATQSWVSSQEFATESWVLSQNYITVGDIPSGLATQSYVDSAIIGVYSYVDETFVTSVWVQNQSYLTSESLSEYMTESAIENLGFATESWVQSQGYLTSETIPSDIATQSWVSSNFLSSTALNGYATESWVQSQGYLTSNQDLSSYATQSWVSSNFLSTSTIWTGTMSEWIQLTSEQQAFYTIALIKA